MLYKELLYCILKFELFFIGSFVSNIFNPWVGNAQIGRADRTEEWVASDCNQVLWGWAVHYLSPWKSFSDVPIQKWHPFGDPGRARAAGHSCSAFGKGWGHVMWTMIFLHHPDSMGHVAARLQQTWLSPLHVSTLLLINSQIPSGLQLHTTHCSFPMHIILLKTNAKAHSL